MELRDAMETVRQELIADRQSETDAGRATAMTEEWLMILEDYHQGI